DEEGGGGAGGWGGEGGGGGGRLPGPIVEPVARDHHLADDLVGREVADEPLRSGMTERAVERAADLARQAERAAVGFRDIDALDLVRPLARDLARQPDHPLPATLPAHLPAT